MPSPQQLSPLYPLDMASWGELYMGEHCLPARPPARPWGWCPQPARGRQCSVASPASHPASHQLCYGGRGELLFYCIAKHMLCTAKHHTWRAATAAAAGPAADTGSASILFAPNTTEVQGLMLLLAKAAACPPDAVQPRRNSSASFYQYWAASAGAAAAAGHPECLSGGTEACRAQPACYLPLYRRQLVGHVSAELAVAAEELPPPMSPSTIFLAEARLVLIPPPPAVAAASPATPAAAAAPAS